MKIKLSRLKFDCEVPNACSMCDDDMNGLYYGNIIVNEKIKIKISLCKNCVTLLLKTFKLNKVGVEIKCH